MVVSSVAAVFLFLCIFLVLEDRRSLSLFFSRFPSLPSVLPVGLRCRCPALSFGGVLVWSWYECRRIVLVPGDI